MYIELQVHLRSAVAYISGVQAKYIVIFHFDKL